MRVNIIQGDITKLEVDAIVNAANVVMLGGGGVDGAIHRAAGPKLREACEALPADERGIRCPTGEARITLGYDLPAKLVIHTVGPIYHQSAKARSPKYDGEFDVHEDPNALLAQAVRSSLTLAVERGVRTIAFPAISCGVFGGSIPVFAKLAHGVLTERDWDLDEVTFVLFLDEDLDVFQRTWAILSE